MIDTNVTCIPQHITILAFSANTAQKCTPTMFRVNPGHGIPNPLVKVESLVRLGVRVITRLGRNLVADGDCDDDSDSMSEVLEDLHLDESDANEATIESKVVALLPEIQKKTRCLCLVSCIHENAFGEDVRKKSDPLAQAVSVVRVYEILHANA